MDPPEKFCQRHAQKQTEANSEQDGNRDIDKPDHTRSLSLHHADKRGKQYDHVDIIHRGSRQNELWDSLRGAISLLHQSDHSRNHYRR